MMQLWERYDSLAFMMWLDPKEYAGIQNSIRDMSLEAKQMRIKRGKLTEAEMSEIVNKQIVDLKNPKLYEEWEEYQDMVKNT